MTERVEIPDYLTTRADSLARVLAGNPLLVHRAAVDTLGTGTPGTHVEAPKRAPVRISHLRALTDAGEGGTRPVLD